MKSKQIIPFTPQGTEQGTHSTPPCLCPYAPDWLRHTLCRYCGQCHYDQCDAKTLPCVDVLAFTVEVVEQQERDQFVVRALATHCAVVQTWVTDREETFVTDSPFLAYREFMHCNPEAVYVRPKALTELAHARQERTIKEGI